MVSDHNMGKFLPAVDAARVYRYFLIHFMSDPRLVDAFPPHVGIGPGQGITGERLSQFHRVSFDYVSFYMRLDVGYYQKTLGVFSAFIRWADKNWLCLIPHIWPGSDFFKSVLAHYPAHLLDDHMQDAMSMLPDTIYLSTCLAESLYEAKLML